MADDESCLEIIPAVFVTAACSRKRRRTSKQATSSPGHQAIPCDQVDTQIDTKNEALEIVGPHDQADSGDEFVSQVQRRLMTAEPIGIQSGSIDEAFRSLLIAVTKMQDLIPHRQLIKTMLVQQKTCSTFFSGMGCVEVAGDMLSNAVKAVFGSGHHKFTVACEVDYRLQELLKCRTENCIFKDILDFVPGLRWQDVRTMGPQQRFDKVCAHFRPQSCQRCVRHESLCRCTGSDFDFSGSPCQPYSVMGKQGGLADERSLLLFVWMAIIRHYRPAIAVHECTPTFFISLLDSFLGPYYHIHHLTTSPEVFGWTCVRRQRVFSILVRKEGTTVLGDVPEIYNIVCKQLSNRQSHLPITCVMIASDKALLDEENRCRRKRKMMILNRKSDDWSYLLTPKQREYLKDYHHLWRDEVKTNPELDSGCIFDLSQNPIKIKVWSGAERRLPTLRKSCYILWSPWLRRWLIGQEIALAQGFPVTETAAAASQTPLDAVTLRLARYGDYGNGIHVIQAALIMCIVQGLVIKDQN